MAKKWPKLTVCFSLLIQSIVVSSNSGDCTWEENEDLGSGSKLHNTSVSDMDCDNYCDADDDEQEEEKKQPEEDDPH